MDSQKYPARFGQGSIYTLAENGTANNSQQGVILYGKGSEIAGAGYGKKRGKRKMISQVMAKHLVDIAKEQENTSRVQSFWNTYHCQNNIYTSAGRAYGRYCKNRFCTICTANRKADLINRYYPVISTWSKPYFVTLTVKACTANRLKIMLQKCIQGIRRIISKYRKRSQRGKHQSLIGVRSLECNFNPVKHTYNPHFHLIVQDRETAEILVKEWLALWTPRFATRAAQHYRPINDLEKTLIEVIKYGTKIFTEPEVSRMSGQKTKAEIYAKAFYHILEAMKGLRLFDRFGFNLPKETKMPLAARITTDFQVWIYMPEYHDWQHTESEQTLAGYMPEQELCNLLEWNIDTTTE